jgi:4,5-dihydroxyphthalate decarboxylase
MAETMTMLKTALGNYPFTTPLKKGELTAPGVAFQFEEIKPVNRAFAPMAREQKFDISEMAIVTYLLARAYNKPLVLLPCVMMGRFQHNTMVYSKERGKITPKDLLSKRLGVRSYTQTTGVWIRGIFQNDYGVDLNKASWTVQEGAHVLEYQDPPELKRIGMEHDLLKMLLGGEVDAVIYGADLPDDPRLATVIENPQAEAMKWYEKHKCVPINHMVCVTEKLAKSDPAAVKAVYELLVKGKQASPPKPGEPDTAPSGFDAVRPGVELITEYAYQQRIIPRRFSFDEIFEDAYKILG